MEQKTYRTLQTSKLDYTGRKIFGYAVVFDQPSRLLCDPAVSEEPFREVICKGAITEETLSRSKVDAVVNHDPENGIYATSDHGKGDLLLTIDDYGVRFEFEAKDDYIGNRLLKDIEAGKTVGCSFGYLVNSANFREETAPNGDKLVFVESIGEICDVTIATVVPAYGGTNVSKRTIMANKEEILNKVADLLASLVEEPAVEPIAEPIEAPVVEETERTTEEEEPKDEAKDEPAEEKESQDEKKEEASEDKSERVEEPKEDEKEDESVNKEEEKSEEQPADEPKDEDEKAERTANLTKIKMDIQNVNVSSFELPKVAGEKKALRTVTSAVSGTSVTKETYAVDQALFAKSKLGEIGMRFEKTDKMAGSFPILTPSNAINTTEGADGSSSYTEGSLSVVNANPHRFFAQMTFTRPAAESMSNLEAQISEGLMNKLYQKVSAQALGYGTNTNGITGLLGTAPTSAPSATDYEDLCELEGALIDAGGENGKFVTNGAGIAKLRSLERGNGDGFVMEGNTVLGYPVIADGNVGKAGITVSGVTTYYPGLIYADWSKVAFCQFGEVKMEIEYKPEFDAYVATANGYFDVVKTDDNAVKIITLN